MVKEEIETQLERNYFLSAIFFILGVLVITFISLLLLPYIPNSLGMMLVMMYQCILLIVLLGRRFFQKEVKYKVTSRKKTPYGETIYLEKI